MIWTRLALGVFVAACGAAAPAQPTVGPAFTTTHADENFEAPMAVSVADGEGKLDSEDVAPIASEEAEPAVEPARHPFHEPLPGAEELAAGSANKWANLSPADCRKRLQALDMPFERVGGPAPGIATPLRITGALGEVHFQVPPARTPFGLLDCRLALILAEMVDILVQHDVVRVRIDNFYRPRARLPRRKKLSQHAHGLAADVVEFTLQDGQVLNVEKDWQGLRGEPSCGPDAKLIEETEKAVRLRNLVCAIAAKGLFHHILTPSYDPAHRDHVHMDIRRDEKWFGYH